MDSILDFVGILNDRIVWGLPMVLLMIGTGIFLTWVTGGVLFRRFSVVLGCTVKTLFRPSDPSGKEQGGISPFGAVCTALAATVGTGNIVGVALAIATGGPGAIFWLWISALVGMVIKYSEVTLAQAYRTTNRAGRIVGGPMYYISGGMGRPGLATLFATLGALAALGIGASVQANTLAGGIHDALGFSNGQIGIVTAVLGGLIFLGGIRRITAVTVWLVPWMSILYIGGALLVLLRNVDLIPGAFALILRGAASGNAAIGGFLGATALRACRVGMARGVFTHEAGMGSAPIAHASATSDHPARQGLWGAFEVFFDSIVMCTLTALVILICGLWYDPTLAADPRTMSAMAFENAFPGGRYIVTLGMSLFAFATIIAWYYYGETCIEYLAKGRRHIQTGYRLVYILMIYWGCVAGIEAVWEFADLFNGLMAIPNLMALLALWPTIRQLTLDFFSNK